ncbi:Homeodomain-like protein [Cordyceps fumosorosea ARSEF 2679]|uniref:Homeodomain-like protein n=1 Tax=Cordyceps fumosorosea (strain ARSEF 2679) TaxID=1081104 RepID=A0A167UBS4_CORFA|nr:Homeodomain-like protein [Cordyceps fumosorosea ARSEF 2679]OAA61427.1 Homeodomain-like protein [Cordyceps fumosorosea ARSEF 2679]
MDPDDSDYQTSVPDGDECNSEMKHATDRDSGQSVLLGEDDYEAQEVSEGFASSQSPRKRSAENDDRPRPFKRQRSHLNAAYLDLLNRDIDDAAHRVCLEEEIDLPDSQLGLTYWSSVEKKQFFEALSRLGKHDLPGVAQRIGTKSAIEVKHYLRVLHEAVVARRSTDGQSYLAPAEYPAAVEHTPPCCHAQEEAADEVSLRQEGRESQREQEKWQGYWDITPEVAAELGRKHKEDGPAKLAFSKLFRVPQWLELSDRLFMNSSIPGSNWRNIDSRPPSIWATTLADFHSLALSITARLVLTTLFVSMSRIRAKSRFEPNVRKTVQKQDVEAAIASLGLSHNARDWWRKSARRMQLDVYENPPAHDQGQHQDELAGETEEEEPMSYDEVEAELADEASHRSINIDSNTEGVKQELQFTDAAEESGVDGDSDGKGEPDDQEKRAVTREINEVLWYSAVGIRDLQSTRRALKLRVETERRQERHADAVDEYASQAAEADMWALLQKAPPTQRPRLPNPARSAEARRSKIDVESLYPMNKMWADDLEYQAEWETLPTTVDAASDDDDDGDE